MTGTKGKVAHAESAENAELAREVQTGLTGFTGLSDESQNPVNPVNPVSKAAVPRLRFKGYEGEWEAKRLKDIAEKVLEKNTARIYSETFTNSAEFGVIGQHEYFDFDVAKNTSGYYVVHENDFVYNPRISKTAPVGPINRNGLGRVGVMSPLYFVFRTHDVKCDYLEVYFKTRCWHPYMYFNGDSGARSDRFSIKSDVFLRMPILMPKEGSEQSTIAAFFTSIDQTISSASSRLTSLRQLKRAMLVKMFPRPGQCVPEIRFKGFDGKWEELRVRDVAERVTRKNLNQESDLPLTISAEHGLIDQGEVFNNRIAAKDVSNYYLVVNGEFAYNRSASDGAPFGAVKRLDRYAQGVLSTLYMVFALKAESVDSDYLVQYYATDLWHRDIALRAAEGARNHGLLNISVEDFFDTRIVVPPSLPEQRKIAAFFRSLDRLIGAAEKKVAKLRQVKASLLERMFV